MFILYPVSCEHSLIFEEFSSFREKVEKLNYRGLWLNKFCKYCRNSYKKFYEMSTDNFDFASKVELKAIEDFVYDQESFNYNGGLPPASSSIKK